MDLVVGPPTLNSRLAGLTTLRVELCAFLISADSALEEAGFELRIPAGENRSFRAARYLDSRPLGQPSRPIPAEHRTLIAADGIADAHILAADADRPVINPAG